MDKTRNAVVQEARELLLVMEQQLVSLAEEGDSRDTINEIFRVVHTIKGSAALVPLERLVSFTHLLENALDGVRERQVALSASQQALLVDCCDYIAELLDAVAAHREALDPDPEKRAKLERDLAAFPVQEQGGLPTEAPPENSANESVSAPVQAGDRRDGGLLWRIDLRFGVDMLRSGMDPSAFLRILASLGRLREVHTQTDLPPTADFDPEACYLRFSLLLEADCEQEEIDSVFEFVRDESDIVVQRCEPGAGSLSRVSSLAAGQVKANDATAPLPIVAATTGPAQETRLPPQAGHPAPRPGREATAQAYVKVPVDRLDALIDLVGELVIAGASANQVAQREQHPAFLEIAQSMETLVGQIRDSSLTLRMIPIGEVFQRFPRMVRSVARQLGKEVHLTMSGGETELDKSMIEKLFDPLMHVVRNAIDHGLETARDREAAGKPPAGALHLAAYHDAGSMVIEVSDDGRGLDYEGIRTKAVERGLMGEHELLTPEEAGRLLFEPGFSTRSRATRLSGRGVGMDVVRQRIASLRGDAEVISQAGQGTLVRLRLPLTLAIIDGFLVMVGDSRFVIPMDMMVECVDLRQHRVQGAAVDLRGETLPYLRLRDVFGLPPGEGKRESMVVVQYGSRQRAGLVVDWLAGEFQAVIKPLGMLFDKVGGLSGSTILGDGRVALILDIPQLIQRAVMAQAGQTAYTEVADDK